MGDFGGGYDNRPRENYARREVDVDALWENNISSGINFSKYDNIKIIVEGENKPPPISKFTEAGLCALLSSNVKRAGYETPRRTPSPLSWRAGTLWPAHRLDQGRPLPSCSR